MCISCGSPIIDGTSLCAHHETLTEFDWAFGNRLMCDFFHRGKVPGMGFVSDSETNVLFVEDLYDDNDGEAPI